MTHQVKSSEERREAVSEQHLSQRISLIHHSIFIQLWPDRQEVQVAATDDGEIWIEELQCK